MLNAKIVSQGIGPNGEFGSVSVAFVNGQLVASVTLAPKACLDAAAKDVGGTIAPEIATAVEAFVGLT